MKHLSFLFVIVYALSVAGCSGSSSTRSSSSIKSTSFSAQLEKEEVLTGAATKLQVAAQATPIEGSVTQSSAGDDVV